MKKILFINGGSRSFGLRFRERCKELGIECVSIRGVHTSFFIKDNKVEIWHKGERLNLNDVDYAFVRVRGKVPHTVSLLLHFLTYLGVKHNDIANIQHTDALEKVTQMIRLSLAEVPVPDSFIFNKFSFDHNKEVMNSWIDYPCVLKADGSKGDMVWKVGSFEDLEKKKKDLKKEMMMVQKFIPNDFDIRVLYVYGEVLGSIKRSSSDDFYNNLAKGGRSEKTEITNEEETLARRSCEVLDVDFGGVDIVRTEKGPMIFEVNTGPQIYGFEEATGFNVSKELVDRIKNNYL